MRNDTYLYTDGLDAARRSGQIALWRASHQANIACKKAIEDSIRQGFDGVHLKEDCAKEVLEEFGFKRVNWVLANTIQEKSGDGRFRPDNTSLLTGSLKTCYPKKPPRFLACSFPNLKLKNTGHITTRC